PGQRRPDFAALRHPQPGGRSAPGGARFAKKGGPVMRAFSALFLSAFVAAAAAGPASRFPVIGYFPTWTGVAPDQAQLDKLTHVNYAFVKPTSEGQLNNVNDALLKDLVKAGHAR